MTHKNWIQFLRYVFGAALLIYIFTLCDLERLASTILRSGENKVWIGLGCLATLMALLIGAWRWYRILSSNKSQLTFRSVFNMLFIGQFFNAFFPGACGGDLVRLYYIAKESKAGTRAENANTVLIDRTIGLFTLLIFGSGLILYKRSLLESYALAHPYLRIYIYLFLGLTLGTLFFVLFFPLINRLLFNNRLLRKWSFKPLFERIYQDLLNYRERPLILFEAIIYSLMNSIFLTGATVCFGYSLGFQINHWDYFLYFPIIAVLSSIPLSPGALGVRESLFVSLFLISGLLSHEAFALSLLIYLGGLTCSLLGGFIFIRYKSKTGTSLAELRASLQAERNRIPE